MFFDAPNGPSENSQADIPWHSGGGRVHFRFARFRVRPALSCNIDSKIAGEFTSVPKPEARHVLESSMQKKTLDFLALAFLVQLVLAVAPCRARAQAEKVPYPAMAALDQYLIADGNSEIALARSAAPASVSDGAEVMVLGLKGYTTAVKGTNGFLCIVERSWGAGTDEPEFWNPKVRSPICFNPSAAKTFAPIFLMKTKLVLAGKSKAEMLKAIATALDKKELPALEPGAMCY